jgi:hypothetical protein
MCRKKNQILRYAQDDMLNKIILQYKYY